MFQLRQHHPVLHTNSPDIHFASIYVEKSSQEAPHEVLHSTHDHHQRLHLCDDTYVTSDLQRSAKVDAPGCLNAAGKLGQT